MKAPVMIFHLENRFDGSSYISVVLIFIFFSISILLIYLHKNFNKRYNSLYYREELFNSLCYNIDDIFIIYHFGKRIIEYVSPNFDRAYGISSKHFKKNPLIFLSHAEPGFKDKLKSLFTTNILTTNYEMEFQLHHPKTKDATYHILRIYPVISHKIVIRYIISISDLTKEKQAQQAIKDALLNAQQANEAKKEFLSHMSHEIKTPINAIIGMTQLAKRSIEDKTRVEDCLNKISEASKNLITLVNNILDLSKMDSNKLNIAHEPFNIKELLDNLTSITVTQAELSQLCFFIDYKELSNEVLLGDSLRLLQILQNCISNSIKFTPPGGTIRLEVSEIVMPNNKVMLKFIIIDTGKGMSEEYIERIFIPFDQENLSIYPKYGGSGLGMSITKNLVTLMSGDIHVSSKLGQGTTVTINLAFDIPDNFMVPEITKSHEEGVLIKPRDLSGHRILVVEDNPINLEIASEFLKFSHVSVDTAVNGMEAMRLFEKSTASYYDIILMDVQMPGLNGYETTKLIRNSTHPDSKQICIIAMSADSYMEDIAMALNSGMNHHISKPINFNHFNQLLERILKKNG